MDSAPVASLPVASLAAMLSELRVLSAVQDALSWRLRANAPRAQC